MAEPWNNPKIANNLSPFNSTWLVHSTGMHGGRLVSVGKIRKKVALIGFEEKNLRTAPYSDPEWEVWGFNMGNRMGLHDDGCGRFRADRWFDLHEQHAQDEKDLDWINTCPCPIYLTDLFGNNPLAVRYPIEHVEAWLGERFGVMDSYWCSSFAYAFALAMFEGFEEIGVFGINLDWGRERVYERGNLEFYMGLAMGSGIKVTVSPNSKLMTHFARYGFEYTREKEAVEQDIGELVRQVLGNEQMSAQADKALRFRHYALMMAGYQLNSQIQRLMHLKPSDVQRLMEEDVDKTKQLLRIGDGLDEKPER